jgi:conjugal transfer pilin signal peptidase TrbI
MSTLIDELKEPKERQAILLERLLNALLIFLVLHALIAWFSNRFLIGHDAQSVLCLKGQNRWYLIDRDAKPQGTGDLLAFRSDDRMAPEIPNGTLVVKRIEAVSGDAIAIEHRRLVIQGIGFETPFPHRGRLKERALPEGTVLVLPEDAYWVMGDHPKSFDSRYFGAIAADQVVGVAHALPF